MNIKVAKELRQMIKDEMPKILQQELLTAQHTKLAQEMNQIIKELVPTILTEVQYQSLYEKLAKEVKERLDGIDKYLKETTEHRAKKLEEVILKMTENKTEKTE